jgi:antitoxin CptB
MALPFAAAAAIEPAMPVTIFDPRRKRLLWRARHRGIKEMDIVLGRFTEQRVASMTDIELSELEAIIDLPDQELLAWITAGAAPAAVHSTTLAALLAFRP